MYHFESIVRDYISVIYLKKYERTEKSYKMLERVLEKWTDTHTLRVTHTQTLWKKFKTSATQIFIMIVFQRHVKIEKTFK